MQDSQEDSKLLGGERAMPPAAKESERISATAASLPVDSASLADGAQRSPRPIYLVAMVGGGVFAIVGFLGLLYALGLTGHLPPPAISNSVCVDEKLSFLRNMPATDPNLLVVGSSVAWRGIDGSVLTEASPGIRPLNGAFCGLHANQARFTADWLLKHFTGVRTILMLAVPQDFTDCADTPAAVFDKTSADAYVFEHARPWDFYFEYFDPVSLMRNALKVAAQRSNRIPLDPLVFTREGDGPLDTSVTRSTLGDHEMPKFDDACFDSLHEMAASASASGRHFTFIQMPMKPEWNRSYDPEGRIHDLFATKIASALSGTGGRSWDASRNSSLPDAAFTDAIHLRWSAVAGLSRIIGQQAILKGTY